MKWFKNPFKKKEIVKIKAEGNYYMQALVDVPLSKRQSTLEAMADVNLMPTSAEKHGDSVLFHFEMHEDCPFQIGKAVADSIITAKASGANLLLITATIAQPVEIELTDDIPKGVN